MDRVVRISENMDYTIPFMTMIAKYLVSGMESNAAEIKE